MNHPQSGSIHQDALVRRAHSPAFLIATLTVAAAMLLSLLSPLGPSTDIDTIPGIASAKTSPADQADQNLIAVGASESDMAALHQLTATHEGVDISTAEISTAGWSWWNRCRSGVGFIHRWLGGAASRANFGLVYWGLSVWKGAAYAGACASSVYHRL